MLRRPASRTCCGARTAGGAGTPRTSGSGSYRASARWRTSDSIWCPPVLTGAAVLVVARKPATSGALTAFGAAVKLRPAIMLPDMVCCRARHQDARADRVSDRRRRHPARHDHARRSEPHAVSGAIPMLNRGLQIESVAASPLMLACSFAPPGRGRYTSAASGRGRSTVPGCMAVWSPPPCSPGSAWWCSAGLWWRALRSDVVDAAVAGLDVPRHSARGHRDQQGVEPAAIHPVARRSVRWVWPASAPIGRSAGPGSNLPVIAVLTHGSS